MDRHCFRPRVTAGGGSSPGGYALRTTLTSTLQGGHRVSRFDLMGHEDMTCCATDEVPEWQEGAVPQQSLWLNAVRSPCRSQWGEVGLVAG